MFSKEFPSMKGKIQAWLHFLEQFMNRLSPLGNLILITLAIAVGMISGLGAVALHWLIESTHTVAQEFPWTHYVPASFAHAFHLAATPAIGALVAGSLVWLLARHDHSHGTSAVMEAVALHGGRLPLRPFVTKIVGAGLLIGSGGSAGPEDPSVQIGGAVGSAVGTRLKLSVARVNTLVTAGVASAIAAAFNAPIAGVFFALEVVAGDFSTTLFAPVVLASVVASIIGRAFLGDQPAFSVPQYGLIYPFIETPLYVVLGLVCALAGAVFIRAFFVSEAFFDKLPLPAPLRAGLGGLLVGIIALFVPDVLGTGYEPATHILDGSEPTGTLLLILLGAKFLATLVTLGAVRVGGTFAPAMVMGSMIGGVFGHIVNLLFPGLVAPPAAFALVGMGAMLTAVVRAPITAVLLLFEITGDYSIILAIMASVVSSFLLSHRLHPESIYTERLARKGIQLRFGRDVNILELVTVGEAMTPDFTTVPRTMTLAQLVVLFGRTQHHGFPVVDEEGKLYGIVTITDLQQATELGLSSKTPVDWIATPYEKLTTVSPEQSLTTALQQFAIHDIGRIPVIDPADPYKLLGVVRRSDIVKAYRYGAMQRAELEHRRQQMSLGSQSGTQLIEVNILPDSPIDGRMIRDIHLPGQAIITAILREGQAMIPRGDSVLHGGDQLTILAMPDFVDQVQEHLMQESEDALIQEPRYHELVLTEWSPATGKTVADLGLPPSVLIVSLRREGHVEAVHGNTRLAAGDEVILLSEPDDLEKALRCLGGEDALA
jgi:CIC family chloride channel protein